MSSAAELASIRSVRLAATDLTLACTEFVGPVSMALSLPGVSAIAQPLPRRLRRDIATIERKERKQ